MKPPELKPLVNKSKTNETADLIRKATKTVNFSPIKTLSEFQGWNMKLGWYKNNIYVFYTENILFEEIFLEKL